MVFRQGCGTHRCVTHLDVCVCSGNGAECQEKYRLYRGIRLLCFVFGLEIQSHLLQMFPVEFIARSYCAALQEKTIKKYRVVPSQPLQIGARVSVEYVPFCCLRKDL